MLARETHRIIAVGRTLTVAIAVVSALLFAPAFVLSADAAPASGSSAQSAQAAAMQADFGNQVASYVAITRELHRTEDEVAQVTKQIADGQSKLQTARSALASRAVELYRNSETDMLESLFSAQSLSDLLMRINYLSMITSRDARMLQDLRLAQTEESWLQESLVIRVAKLQGLQATADKQQAKLLADLKVEQARAAAAKSVFTPGYDAGQVDAASAGSDPRSKFVRSDVVSEANFRNGGAMTAAGIQAFLNAQPGALKSYTGKDHFGTTKSAAQMISDACIRFNINPKIMLATLQKEQSLLSTKHPTQYQYDWAFGAGKADTFTTSSMKGFGNQVYWGAQKFDKNAHDWHQGATESVDGNSQVCDNEGTFAQYRYTPHYSGVMSFWTIFWRYFGDPLA